MARALVWWLFGCVKTQIKILPARAWLRPGVVAYTLLGIVMLVRRTSVLVVLAERMPPDTVSRRASRSDESA